MHKKVSGGEPLALIVLESDVPVSSPHHGEGNAEGSKVIILTTNCLSFRFHLQRILLLRSLQLNHIPTTLNSTIANSGTAMLKSTTSCQMGLNPFLGTTLDCHSAISAACPCILIFTYGSMISPASLSLALGRCCPDISLR